MQRDDMPWNDALMLLSEVMESRRIEPCHLVVCGGVALLAAGVISRSTKDVDVLALRGEVDGEIGAAWPLPDALKEAVAEVAVEMGLPTDWVNASTSLLIGPLEGLPPEVWSDLWEEAYGTRLRISYVGRAGQILLKLNAALDRREPRDLDDLKALAPTATECHRALRWISESTAMDAVRQQRLNEILKLLGHASE